MMSSWVIDMKINDCVTIFSGGTPSTKNPDYWGGEFNWLSSGETRGMLILDTEKKITQNGVDNSSTKLARPGDVVIASAGQGKTRGQTSLILIDTYVNQSVLVLRPDIQKINPYVLFFNMYYRYEEMRIISNASSSRGSLTKDLIDKMEIDIPHIDVQNEIGAQLQNMCDLMQKNIEQISVIGDMMFHYFGLSINV
jgi:type I restriction enzyme, S subunit